MNLNPHQFKGHAYEDEIEMVPTSSMHPLREYDREKQPNTDLDALTEDIRTNGIREPMILLYGQDDRKAVIGEGNHRLAAAERLGMEEVPARVARYSRVGDRGGPVPGYQGEGHVNADLRPSQIGLPGRKP